MKIAVVSCYFINNYGSVLQAYATQKYLAQNSAVCHTVNVEGIKPLLAKGKKEYYFANIFDLGLLKSKLPMIKLKLMGKLGLHDLNEKIAERHRKFDVFRSHFDLTESVGNFAQLGELSRHYDVVVLGGDQLWRPDNIFPGYYTLEWVAEDTKKVSLGTSFGVSRLDKASAKRLAEFLPGFSGVSVREESGAELVRQHTGMQAKVVCDPVFLLDREEWQTIADTSKAPNGGYIFTYFLGESRRGRQFAEKLSQATGLPIVSVPFMDCYTAYDGKVDGAVPEASPEDFVGLISEASFVCTDSFHAMAFSVLFQREFYGFSRFSGKKGNTNTRVKSLLGRLGLTHRYNTEAFDREDTIDYGKVNGVMRDIVDDTKEFIRLQIFDGGRVIEKDPAH